MKLISLNRPVVEEKWGRHFLYGNTKIPFYHLIWNHFNPNNKWEKGFHIHHIDKNPLHDWITNLRKITNGEHTKLHHINTKHSEEHKLKISERMKGHKHSEETKAKMSGPRKRYFTKQRGEI